MTSAAVFGGTSLDGFIARPEGGLDFLGAGGNEAHGYEEFIASVEALVMGRKTYEMVPSFGGWHCGTKPVFVLSATAIAAPPEGAIVEHLSGDPGEIVAQVAERGIDHIYVDGGDTIQRFLRAGLIQRLIITRLPVLIGSGIALFGDLDQDLRLKHVATCTYPSGLVQSEYAVVG